MNNPVVWGFDIGGTKCALCAADASGTVLCRWQLATADYAAWQDVMEALVQWGQAHAPAPSAAGVSCGGPLDLRSRTWRCHWRFGGGYRGVEWSEGA